LLLDNSPGSLFSQLDLARSFLPGPLEGSSRPVVELPEDVLEAMRADLSQPQPAADAFSGLANAALLCRIPDDVVDLAAEALDRASYYLQHDENQPLIGFLVGLATVGAITRNHKLANAVFTCLRNYRYYYRVNST